MIFSYHFSYNFADTYQEFDLLPQNLDQNGAIIIDGDDGYIAYCIKQTEDIKKPVKMMLPEKIYEFSIVAKVRQESRTAGYLFSVVDSLEETIQLGLHVSAVQDDKRKLKLLYSDLAPPRLNKVLATFEIPFTKKWTEIGLKVLSNRVLLYLNCMEVGSVDVVKQPDELVLDSAALLYYAQAGPKLNGKIEVCN